MSASDTDQVTLFFSNRIDIVSYCHVLYCDAMCSITRIHADLLPSVFNLLYQFLVFVYFMICSVQTDVIRYEIVDDNDGKEAMAFFWLNQDDGELLLKKSLKESTQPNYKVSQFNPSTN